MTDEEPITSRAIRKTYWFTAHEIEAAGTCPSCGRSLRKFKNVTAHAKRCFSIKRIGPIYRLHGYVECKCGILIADNTKAHKLHLCSGEIPAFEPDLSYLTTIRSLPATLQKKQPTEKLAPVSTHLERDPLQPRIWIRNFASPIKLEFENINECPKPEPRVRNFDMVASKLEAKSTSVYTIDSNNGAILEIGQTTKSENNTVIMLARRSLRLPRVKSANVVSTSS